MARRIGVCSWSLRPHAPGELADRAAEAGVKWVQLALEPLRAGRFDLDATLEALRAKGIGVASAMMEMAGEDYTSLASIRATGGLRPDSTWALNEKAAAENAELVRRLGVTLVTFHAGFVPHERGDAERSKLVGRIREVADRFAAVGASVGLETGQETAATLLDVLAEIDHPNVGVNFDPANLVLYGMGDPVDALARLAPHVRQIHVKDARATKSAGSWGEEVPVGTGDVDWEGFDQTAREHGVEVDLMIERESGEDRVADVRRARALIESLVA